MKFHPAVLPVNDVRPCSRNSIAAKARVKNILAEAIANTFLEGIGLRNMVAANRLQDEITLLLF